jgi:phage FluMu gp28-like protein
MFKWEPFDYQVKAISDKSNKKIYRWGRQTGKSTVSSIEGIFAAMTRPKITVLIVSPVQRQSSLLFRKMKNLITELSQHHPEFTDDNQFKYVVRETATVIEFANGSVIHSLPAGDDASGLRGFTAHIIILDEAAQIKDEVFVALKPMFATTWKSSQWLMISTPKGVKNYFYEACNKNIHGYKEYVARSKDSPLITDGFLTAERESMTLNEYLQEYEAEFVSEADTFFTLDEIRDIMVKECPSKTEPDKNFEYYLGFDPAMLGEDEAVGVILERRPEYLVSSGAKEFAVVNYIVKGKSSISEQIGLIKNLNRVWHFKRIVIDQTGFGMELVKDMIKDIGMNIEGITFTVKSIEDLYLNAKKFFETRAFIMPPSIKMKQQLNEMKYEYRKHDGRLNVFNPNKRAKTDHPTALVLALWATKKTVHTVTIVTARGIYSH